MGVRAQVLPAGLVLAGAVSVQSGAGIADRLFGQLPPASVTTLRLWAAALILLEHQWAVPLRNAIAAVGGFRISDGFISPLDLVEVGLHTDEEAQQLHALETSRQPA